MQFRNLSLITRLIFCLGLSGVLQTSRALAEGHGAPAAEGEGAAAPPAIPKDQKEYTEKNTKLNSLISKIAESEKQFAELVHHKNESKTTAAKQHIIHEMNELSKQRNLDVDAYNSLRSDLELRYPNQGIAAGRSYKTQEKRSVEELEGVAGLDELLTRTKKIVEKKFAPFMDKEPKSVAKFGKKKHEREPAAADEPKRLRLEK